MKIQRGIPIQQEVQNPDQKIRDASKMYEQYFLNEMMKSMRKTIDHSALNKPGMGEKIYTEQLDQQYVQNWSDRGGVGLADIIYNQLQERFFDRGQAPKPAGPLPIQKGTTIKIDETKQQGLPILSPKSSLPANEVSFLYEWDPATQPQERDVVNPYDGQIVQAFRLDHNRQILKVAHEHGLQSTISFLGETQDLRLGDQLPAGFKMGRLAPDATGLTWQIQQTGT